MLRHSSLIVNPMPPRITEQSYRPRVSDRTMVATCRCNRFACCASEIDRVCAPPFPLRKPSQNGPRGQGFATPRRYGAPLTPPGRSEEAIPHKRERRVGKLNDPASKHLALHRRDHPRATTPRGTCTAAGGLDVETRLPARGRAFSLDILFYRTRRWRKLVADKRESVSSRS